VENTSNNNNIDKKTAFMNSSVTKNQQLPNSYIDPKIDKYVPFYQSKEAGFWNSSLEKSGGGNASKDIRENYKRFCDKIFAICKKKGWLSMRTLRSYLKCSCKKGMVSKANLKFFLTNFGLFPTDGEMDAIYSIYDKTNKDEINVDILLDELIVTSEARNQLIESFLSQITSPEGKICSKTLEKSLCLKDHPDVVSLRKSVNELKNDFTLILSPITEKGMIYSKCFLALLRDISFSVESDDDFVKTLISCGFR